MIMVNATNMLHKRAARPTKEEIQKEKKKNKNWNLEWETMRSPQSLPYTQTVAKHFKIFWCLSNATGRCCSYDGCDPVLTYSCIIQCTRRARQRAHTQYTANAQCSATCCFSLMISVGHSIQPAYRSSYFSSIIFFKFCFLLLSATIPDAYCTRACPESRQCAVA